MGDFDGKRWRPYLDQDTQDRRDEIIDHLEQNYDGPSDFVKQKLMEEKPLDIDEQIKRARQDKNELEEKLSRLEQIKKEREQASQLRDKRELLKEKQKKLKEASQQGYMSEEKIREEVIQKCKDKVSSSGQLDSIDELSIGVDERVRRRVEKQPVVDELVKEVQRLQDEIESLNGGREDFFIDLEDHEEVRQP